MEKAANSLHMELWKTQNEIQQELEKLETIVTRKNKSNDETSNLRDYNSEQINNSYQTFVN